MFERLKKRVVVAATLLLTFCCLQLQAANVAQVVGGSAYTSLQAAFDNVPENGTVQLIADCVGGVVFPANSAKSQIVNLDLNGFKLTSSVAHTQDRFQNEIGDVAIVLNGGSLTVKDSSVDGTGELEAGADGLFLNFNYGSNLNIEGGRYETSSTLPLIGIDSGLLEQSDDIGITANVSGGFVRVLNFASNSEQLGDDDFYLTITGGTFGEDPTSLVAGTDWRADQRGSVWEVTARDYVALIGNTGKYESLAEAVADANDGDTITLQHNCSGVGIQIPANTFTTDGLTIDLNGYTYTCNGSPVGSTGTENQAFQLLQGNKITFKNGTLQVAENVAANFRFVIQNYSDLTLEGVTVNGTNLKMPNKSHYTVSNNNGSSEFKAYMAGTVGEKETEIIASQTGGTNFAFDVCRYATYSAVSVTVDGATINGNVEVSASNNNAANAALSIQAATFSAGSTLSIDDSAASATVTKGANVEVALDSNYPQYGWDANNRLVANVAQIGGNKYTTLAGAVEAAQSGETIKLLMNVPISETVEINKNLTLNLNGKNIEATNVRALQVKSGTVSITGEGTISANGDNLSADSSVIRVGDAASNPANPIAASLTIGAGVRVESVKCYGVTVFGRNDGNPKLSLTVEGTVAVTGARSAISGTGNSYDGPANITIASNAVVSSTGDYAIYNPQAGTLAVAGTVTGGIEAKAGTVTIKNAAVVTARTGEGLPNHTANGNGPSTQGYALAVVNNSGYVGNVILNVQDGTIEGKLAIVTDGEATETGKFAISGGTFDEFVPEAYCAIGFIPTDADDQGKYTVEEGEFIARNMTTGKGYKALAAAVAAVGVGETEPTTIKLLKSVAGPGVVVQAGHNIVIDFNGCTYTVNQNVGSTGTETSGFQLLAGSTVELKNGTLTSTTAKILIQNYSDLTLTDMILDGTQSEGCTYVVSNNNGSLDVKGATSITAREGAKAFDVCVTGYYPNGVDVTIGTTGTITGDIEYGVWGDIPNENKTSLTITNGTFDGNWVIDDRLVNSIEEKINISGGTFSVAVPEEYCKDGYIPKDLGNGQYGVQEGFYVARIIDETGDTPVTIGSYTNFVDTLAALNLIDGGYEGLTIKLVHANVSLPLALPNGVYFDTTLYNDTFTGALTAADDDFQVVRVPDDNRILWVTESKYVAQIGTTKYDTLTDAFKAASNGDTVKVLKNFTESVAFPSEGSSRATQLTVDLNGFTMTGTNFIQIVKVTKTLVYTNVLSSTAFFIGDDADLTITNSSDQVSGILARDWPNANDFPYCALFVDGYNSTVTIADGTYVENEDFPMVLFDEFEEDNNVGFTLNIDGGVFEGSGYVLDDIYDTDLTNVAVNVTDGDFSKGGLVNFAADGLPYAVELKGGVYCGTPWTQQQIEPYVAKDYMVERDADGNWLVRAMVIVAQAVSSDGTTTNKFESLAGAVAAANDGDTVTLLVENYEGAGIFLGAGSKTITIDLGNNEFTCVGPAVGSTGTESQALHLEAGNTVTIKNGSITSSADSGVLMLVQNYCNLTLDDVDLVGTNLPGSHRYVLSNNCGEIELKNGTTVTAKTGDIAIDSCKYASYEIPTLTINGATVVGPVELTGGNLELVAGTFDEMTLTGTVGAGTVQQPANGTVQPPSGFAWTTTEADEGKVRLATAVAQIGTTTYASLIEAVAAVPASSTATIEVLRCSEGAGIALWEADQKNITINLGTNTYTVVKDAVGSNGTKTQAFHFEEGNTVTINATTDAGDGKTGTLSATAGSGALMLVQNYCDLTLNGVVLDGTQLPGTGRYVLSNNSGNVTLTGGTTVTAKDGDIAIDSCKYASYEIPTLTINGATVVGSVELTGGNLELVAGTFDDMTLTGSVGAAKVQQLANGTVLPPAGWAWTTTGADEGKVRLATAVAQIGSTTYASLIEAVAAVPANGQTATTIDLLCCSEGAGIALWEADQKTITFNLGTNTYTVVKDAVGSNGTPTQGFHFEKGNTVTINGGKLTSTCADVKMLIQNYCDLTLDGVVVDGSNLPGSGRYVLSNNSGNIQLTGGTRVTAKDDDIAIDSCKYASYEIPTLTINGATVVGPVELTGGNLELVAGTFGDMTLTGTVGAGKVQQPVDGTVQPPSGFAWTTTGADEGKVCLGVFVAEIGNVGYATLADAVAAVPANTTATIEVLRCSEGAGIALWEADQKNITFNLGTNTYTVVNNAVGSNGTPTQGFHFEKGNTVTINGGKLTSNCADVKMLIQNYCDLTLNGVEVDGSNLLGTGRYVLSNNSGNIQLTGGTMVTAKAGDIAIDSCKYASYDIPTLTINDATVVGPVELTGGNLELVAGTFGDMTLTGTVGAGKVQQPVDGTVLPPSGFAWTTTGADEGKVCLGLVVAKIGNVGYATLADAVAAAESGDTITLVESCSGAGLFLEAGSKTIIIDMDGKTFNCTGPAVGSNGTQTQALHLEAGNTVTIKNGKISATADSGVLMLVQNYCNLTLQNVELDGSKLPGDGRYVLSNNSGTVNLTGNTSVTAKTGHVAIDACKYGSYAQPTVYLNTTGTITGNIELTGGAFNYMAGTIDGDVNTGSNYADTQVSGFKVRVGAQPTNSKLYFDLQTALNAAGTAETTATLLDDINVTTAVDVTGELTLDLNSKKVVYEGEEVNRAGVLVVHNGATLTVTDASEAGTGAIKAQGTNSYSYAAILMTKAGDSATTPASLTLEKGLLEGYYYGITGNGSRDNTAITINGGTVTAKAENDNFAIYNPQAGTVTINGGTLTGYSSAIEMRSGTLTITNGTLTATAESFSATANGNGTTVVGAAVAISQHNTNKELSVNISGGELNGVKAVYEEDLQDETVDGISIEITGGKFAGAIESENVKKFVSGGVFTAPVYATYCAEGLSSVDNPDSATQTQYPYAVLSDVYIYHDEAAELDVKIPRSWITSDNGLGIAASDATDETIDTALAMTKTNGLMAWQNYVLGIANDAKLQVSFKKAAESTAAAPKTQVLFDLTFNAPANTGVSVSYTLVTSTDGGGNWTPGTASASPAFTIDMPNADKTLYFIKVSIVQEQANQPR